MVIIIVTTGDERPRLTCVCVYVCVCVCAFVGEITQNKDYC